MLFDKQTLFSDAQAITATAASTNYINTGARDTPQHAANAITRDLGKGRKPDIRVQVVEDFNNLTSVQVDLEQDDDNAFGSAEVVATSGAIPLASLVAGYIVPNFELIPRGTTKQFLRLNYTVVGTTPTTGKITAGLVFANEERDV